MRFEEELDGARVALAERMSVYENVLQGAAGLFAASESVDRREWSAYVQSVSADLNQRFPGLDAFGFIQRVDRKELEAFLEAARAEGLPASVDKPKSDEDDLLIVQFLEPVTQYQSVIGRAINDDPRRLAAAERARDKGITVVSGEVRLDGTNAGFLMMLPIYRSGSVPETLTGRREEFEGVAYLRFVTDQLMGRIFNRPDASLRVRVVDGDDAATGAVVFDSGADQSDLPADFRPAFTAQVPFGTGGRIWTLDFSSSPSFDSQSSRLISTMVAGGGLVVSLLLFGIAWSLSQTRERALRMAAEMTGALRGANEQLRKEILDREHAQHSTKESEALYHSLVESLPLSILRKDLQGRFTFANQRFCNELGKSLEDIIGRTEFELFPAEQAALHKQEEDRILESGHSLEAVQEFSLSNSDNRFVQVIKTPLRDSEGDVVGLQGIFWDVTDKHRVEAELRQERELLHTLLDNVPDPIYFKDEQSRFLRVSRAMVELFSVNDPSEVIGKSDFDFFGEEHARQAYDDEQRIIRTGQPVIGLVEREDLPNGTHRWASTTKMPMRNNEGRVVGTFGVSRDITRMKEAGQELQLANERLQSEVAEREQAEQVIRDSEALYHSLVESLPLALLRKDLEGRFTFANQRFCKQAGKSLEDILGKTELDLFGQELAAQHQQEDDHIIATGESLDAVQEISRPETGKRFVQVIKNPLRDGAGNVIGVQGIFWDVTDKQRMEEELRHERFLLHALMENLPDRIYFKDLKSRFLRNSRAHVEALGITDPKLASGKSDFDFFSEEHARKAYEDEQRLIQTGKPVTKEEKLTYPDGRVNWVLSTKMPLRDENGQIIGTFGISRDITPMRKAQAELQHERDLLHTILDNVPDRIYFKDHHSRILRISRAHAELFKLKDPSEAVGKTDFDFFTSEHAQQAYDDEQRIIQTGEPVIGLVEKETLPGGEIRWASTTKMPVRDEKGKIVGTFGVTRDITEMKRASEALRVAKEAAEAASQTKSQFLANMSHELRTPLNSIIGFSNIILKNKAGTLTASEVSFLERILANGKHLLELINEILDLSKIEARRVELQVSSVKLDELIKETVAQQEGLVRDRPVHLLHDLPDHLAPIRTDPDKLKQVIINLIGNALKFTEKGSVTLRVTASARSHRPLRIDVVDTGIGIPNEKLGAIFQAFQQAEATTARRFGGTGLGLTISQALCQLMGHRIEVSSKVGEGSTFSVILHAQPGATGVDPDEESPSDMEAGHLPDVATLVQGKRVLVIDDEPDSRLLLRHMLEEFGCDVMEARSGQEGLQLARSFRPHLITVDLMMPRMTGSEVVGAIKADPDLKHIPVVVVSIVSGEYRGQILGAVQLLQKPIVREELLEALKRHLPRRAERILVVDDDDDSRQLMRSFLEPEQFEVRTAANGREAEEVLSDWSCDLILLDLMMPEMDGFTFLQNLRANPTRRNLPVVVVSSKDLTRKEANELRMNATGVLRKSEALAQDLQGVMRKLFGAGPADAAAGPQPQAGSPVD